MSSIEQHLEYLEEANGALRIQNHVLTATLKNLTRSLPSDMANDTAESIQLAFEDTSAELSYKGSPHTDLFYDVACTFL